MCYNGTGDTLLGIDIVENERIEKIYNKYGERFLKKVFTDREIEYILKKKNPIETLSGHFAAKEAISKAYGTGIGRLNFKDIEILHSSNGAPSAFVRGEEVYLSISHERKFSVATATVPKNSIIIPREFLGTIPKRNPISHKSDYGRVGIVAGSMGMTGSVYLASNAALKMGAGLVFSVVPEDIFEIMSVKLVEPIAKSFKDIDSTMEFLEGMDAVCIGPGMGTGGRTGELVKRVLLLEKPVLIDADGINVLGRNLSILKDREYPTVLTPHAGEFSNIVDTSSDEIDRDRKTYAAEFAKEYGVTLVLKGNKTLVATRNNLYVNKSGNPGMATAGSGDVLSGIITALLARGLDDYLAAKLGVFVHGLAGDIAAHKYTMESMVASDIVSSIHKVLKNSGIMEENNERINMEENR